MGDFFINGKWYKADTYVQAKQLADAAGKAPVMGGPKVHVPPPVLNPLAAAVRGIATPKEVLVGRGTSGATVHLGVGEQVDLKLNTIAPPIGFNFKWTIQGDAELTGETATTALLTAGPTAGNVTATLKINGGPHNGHKLSTLEFKVVAPTGTVTRQSPEEPLLRHSQGTAGVGFKMWINMLPNNVVFSRLQWREHTGLGLATGHFEGENGRVHAPSGVGYDPVTHQPLNTLSDVWMTVYGVYPPPHGVNWIGQVDKVDTGDHPPVSPGVWKASSHKWNIEWRYRVKRSNGTFSGEQVLERAMHESTIATNGTATIKKGDAGPFTATAPSATSGYA